MATKRNPACGMRLLWSRTFASTSSAVRFKSWEVQQRCEARKEDEAVQLCLSSKTEPLQPLSPAPRQTFRLSLDCLPSSDFLSDQSPSPPQLPGRPHWHQQPHRSSLPRLPFSSLGRKRGQPDGPLSLSPSPAAPGTMGLACEWYNLNTAWLP